MKQKLKLYVLENVLTDYTNGIMFALAASPKHARRLILKHTDHVNQDELNTEPKLVSKPQGFAVYGGG